jgi:hypothetical protein
MAITHLISLVKKVPVIIHLNFLTVNCWKHARTALTSLISMKIGVRCAITAVLQLDGLLSQVIRFVVESSY